MSDFASELQSVIHDVRRRWRIKLAIRGALAVLGIGFLVFLASASALEAARFTPGAILAARIGLAVAIAALLAIFFVRPMLRRVSDQQVALYLEEHEPSLQEAIVSAVEAARVGEGDDATQSRALVRKLVETAVRKSQEVEHGRRVERQPVRRYTAAIAATAVAALMLVAFGPAYLRNAASAMLVCTYRQITQTPFGKDQMNLRIEDRDDPRRLHVRCMNTGTFVRFDLTGAQGGTFADGEMGMDPDRMSNRVFDAVLGRRYFKSWLEQTMEALETAAKDRAK